MLDIIKVPKYPADVQSIVDKILPQLPNNTKYYGFLTRLALLYSGSKISNSDHLAKWFKENQIDDT